jgi:hypothetical protein
MLALAAALTVFSGAALANTLANGSENGILGSTFTHEGTCTVDTWHFVHTGTNSSDLPSTLHAHFQNAGWVTASGFVPGGGSIVQYNVTGVPLTDMLLDDTYDSIDNDGNLNLSHTCAGSEPSESASVSESIPGESSSPSETPFSSEQGETATPFSSEQGKTAPPSGTAGSDNGGSSPLLALAIAGLFGLVGMAAARKQRQAVRR